MQQIVKRVEIHEDKTTKVYLPIDLQDPASNSTRPKSRSEGEGTVISLLLQLDLIAIPQVSQQRLHFCYREIRVEQESPARRTGGPAGVTADAKLHQLGLDGRAASPSSAAEYRVRAIQFSFLSLHSLLASGGKEINRRLIL